jgi:hypothetical protein
MEKIKVIVEIGENLARVIEGALMNNANKGGVSLGEEIQKAFKLNLTEVSKAVIERKL